MNNFSFQYPLWFLVFCVLAGLAYAIVLYYREKKFADQATWKRWLMAFLRFLSVTSISALLLGPLLKITEDEQKNATIVVVQDASTSIKNNSAELLKELAGSLGSDFQVDSYHFDEGIAEDLVDTLDGKTTNISSVFEFLDETYANQNLGAIIMSTDGIYNEGQNPLYQQTNLTAPIYFIAQGDTTQKKDISIKQLYHNKIAYLGDKFVVQADVQAFNFNNTNTSISLFKDEAGKRSLIDKQTVQINSSSYFTTFSFEVPANQVGIVKYYIEISGRPGEFSTRNNKREFFVDILDARQKILMISNAPHPDIAALRNIVATNKNYEFTSALASDPKPNLAAFDFVIFHNLPSKNHPISSEIATLNQLNKPRMFIAGTEISIPGFNKVQNVLKISANTNSTNEVQATVVSDFKLFEQSQEFRDQVGKYPPMKSKFGEFTADPNTTVLLKQKIGQIQTDYPLLAMRNQSGLREVVLAGEGIWQWRLFNYLQQADFEVINELVGKTIQYATVKDDKRKFRVSSANNIYKTYDRIAFDAELYNDSYEKVNEVDAFLTIKNSSGQEFKYTFSRLGDFYQLDAGSMAAGNYSFVGSTSYSGKQLTSAGKFSVQEIQLEQSITTADHALLKALTSKHGGEIFYSPTSTEILDKIRGENNFKPIIYSSTKTESALNLRWILFALLGLLCLEWFIRRFLGSY